jgi:hypothetical protein
MQEHWVSFLGLIVILTILVIWFIRAIIIKKIYNQKNRGYYISDTPLCKNIHSLGMYIRGYTQDDYLFLKQKVEQWNHGNPSRTFSTKKAKKYFNNNEFIVDKKIIEKYAKELEIEEEFIIIKCEGSETIGLMSV